MAFIRNANWNVNTGPTEYDTVNGQAVPVRRVWQGPVAPGNWSEWRRYNGGTWDRREGGFGGDYAHVGDAEEPGVFRALVCGTLLGGRFACPDAAREAADNALAADGKLEASRAFVRLGEWEEDGVSHYRTKGGTPWHHAYMVAKKAEVDAELVASGALDPSRAFKAGPTLASVFAGPTGVTYTQNTATRMPPEKHNSVPQATGIEGVRAAFAAMRQPAKPAWGEWEYVTFVNSAPGYLRPSIPGGNGVVARAGSWQDAEGIHRPATDIDDAREKADAFLVARGELEAGRAFKRVGDWTTSMPVGEGHDRLWEAQGVCVRVRGAEVVAGVARGVVTDGFYAHSREAHVSGALATSKDAQQLADAELVRRGLLAEERAFKVAKPSAVSVQRILMPGSAESFTVESDGARPFNVRRSPDGQTRVTDWGGASYAVEPGDALTYTITDGVGKFAKKARVSVDQWAVVGTVSPTRTIAPGPEETVTLANWERCLPLLLSSAPREFRDGFNRKQGPAWEAYLVALAGVKEEIQIRRTTPSVGDVVQYAAGRARHGLGVEWTLANCKPAPMVFGPPDRWDGDNR